jgi:hypothetical protein
MRTYGASGVWGTPSSEQVGQTRELTKKQLAAQERKKVAKELLREKLGAFEKARLYSAGAMLVYREDPYSAETPWRIHTFTNGYGDWDCLGSFATIEEALEFIETLKPEDYFVL